MVYRCVNVFRGEVFKDVQCYVLKPTNPCAVAYRYARIRRLVRLGGGR